MRWWILAVLMGCSSGLQSTSAECKDGYERGEDGGCYDEDGEGEGENALPGGTGDGDDDDDRPTGGDAGDVDEGAPADDPPGDDDFDDECENDEDCTIDRCPEGSMGCSCLVLGPEEAFCVPTCNNADDCPTLGEEVFSCNEGICEPAEV